MKKKIILITVVSIFILSILCMYNYRPVVDSYWLEHANIEEKTSYFLQTNYNEKWQELNPNIKFDFNQESGHNSLLLNNYTIQTQVTDKREDILNTVIEEQNKHAMILFVTRFKNGLEAQAPISNNGTLHIWDIYDSEVKSEKKVYDIPIQNGKFESNEKMEHELGFATTTMVAEVEKNREQYTSLLNQLAEKELKEITNLRNFRLLISSATLLTIISIVITIICLINKRKRKREDFYRKLENESN